MKEKLCKKCRYYHSTMRICPLFAIKNDMDGFYRELPEKGCLDFEEKIKCQRVKTS